jgi:hypothetical protein
MLQSYIPYGKNTSDHFVEVNKMVLACVGMGFGDFREKKHTKIGDHFAEVSKMVLACVGVTLW